MEQVFGLHPMQCVDVVVEQFVDEVGEVRIEGQFVLGTQSVGHYCVLLDHYILAITPIKYSHPPPNIQQSCPYLSGMGLAINWKTVLFIILMRYAKQRRVKVLPSIQASPSNLQQLLKKEQSLAAELEQLDQVLKADRLTSINGFIFTTQVKKRLPDDIVDCISKQHRLLSYGFELWGRSSYESSPVRQKLVVTKPTFKEKLLQASMKSVEKYEFQKQRQLERLHESRWKVSSTSQSKVSKSIKLKTQPPNNERLTSFLKNNQNAIYNYNIAKKIVTEAPIREEQAGPYQVQKMLRKFINVVSIWLPPKTYPQFYGIIVPSISQTTSGGTRCRIKKYMLFKQGLNYIFFNSLLSYLSQVFQTDIESLQMMMDKSCYLSYFKNCGWKMKSWEGVDKINAIFVGYNE